jgi:murein DD-endopeptidase MepM/ murein hydrolase activator NlpD
MNPLVVAVLLAAAPGGTPFDSAAAHVRGRELLAAVGSGDAATLWGAFGERMRTAMKDSASFAGMTAGIHGQTGALDSVLDQRVVREGEHWAYQARCRFQGPPVPLMVTLAFADNGRLEGLNLKPDTGAPKPYPSTHLEYQTRTPLRLPFEGEWYVFWGGRTIEQNYHAATRSQRFAHDLVIRREGRTHAGEGKALTDYHCYGKPILAPGAGTVVWSENTRPDQPIGTGDRSNPIGNGVVIDHGNGEFSLLAHLKPGSVKVKPGDAVKPGQTLGACGNSGNTSEPHLHYHLQNGPDMKDADGLPAFFRDLIVDDKPVQQAEIVKGQRVRHGR